MSHPPRNRALPSSTSPDSGRWRLSPAREKLRTTPRWRTLGTTASPFCKSRLLHPSPISSPDPQTLTPSPLVPQAEKEIQAAKYRLLEAKIAAARRLERRRLLLERRAAEFASRALAARADIDATHARRLVLARDLSSTRCEIEEAERKEGDWDRFYESKRKEMEDFQAMSQQFEAEARKEVQRLKDLVSQLQSALQELQSNGMYSNDAEIAAAEARKSDLTAKKAKLEESLVSARQFRALLQQQLQKAFASQVGDQKAAQN
ncbi:hypothetical protein QYE76_022009 [Lolium multiflorum]|uniref:Uncharacterized protein n=1 Tax=Lolium multiflorum TaxID=4521 RepID=A0AAD8R8T1_LOLMU|nr:hypothetical protein QYE76_022009 [Lolium multiflorum]